MCTHGMAWRKSNRVEKLIASLQKIYAIRNPIGILIPLQFWCVQIWTWQRRWHSFQNAFWESYHCSYVLSHQCIVPFNQCEVSTSIHFNLQFTDEIPSLIKLLDEKSSITPFFSTSLRLSLSVGTRIKLNIFKIAVRALENQIELNWIESRIYVYLKCWKMRWNG